MLLAALGLWGAMMPAQVDAGVMPSDLRMSLGGQCPDGRFQVELLVHAGRDDRVAQLVSSGRALARAEIDKLNAKLRKRSVEYISPGICDSKGARSLAFYLGVRDAPQVVNGALSRGEVVVYKIDIVDGVLSTGQ